MFENADVHTHVHTYTSTTEPAYTISSPMRLANYFYILRNGFGRGYSCPSGHLLELKFILLQIQMALDLSEYIVLLPD